MNLQEGALRSAALRFAGTHWPAWHQYYEYAMKFPALCKLTDGDVQELRKSWKEISGDQSFQEYLRKSVAEVLAEGAPEESIGAKPLARTNVVLYVLVRALKPDMVMETGVGHGVSTSYILKGLDRNNRGVLHSVDFPRRDPGGYIYEDGTRDPFALPPGREPGWIVPTHLRNRWVLHLGKSREVLPTLLEQLKTIDMFFHDSEHSYENMFFEFELAWRFLRDSGILVSDDIHWNNAFRDFAGKVGRDPVLLFYRGALRR